MPHPKLKGLALLPLTPVMAVAFFGLSYGATLIRIPHVADADKAWFVSGCYAFLVAWQFIGLALGAIFQPASRPLFQGDLEPEKFALWALLVIPSSILIGRAVVPEISFGFLPSWWGVLLGPGVAGYVSSFFVPDRSLPNRYVSGAKKLSEKEKQKSFSELSAAAGAQGNAEPSLKWLGVPVPGSLSEGHFCVVGTPGSGKTLMHRELMAAVLPTIKTQSDRRAILYDVKGDALSFLKQIGVNPGDRTVLNPFDARSRAWAISKDIKSDAEVDTLAASLIPERPNETDPFFSSAARDLLREVIRLFVRQAGEKWTLRDLIHVTASPARLKVALSGTKGGKEFFDQYRLADAAFGNFIQQLGTALRPLSTVAALWESSKKPAIQLSRWVEDQESILVFNGQPSLRASLVPLNRLMFNYLSDKLTSGKSSPKRARCWVFLDEIQDASRLSGLMPLLNLGRSFGIRCVLGFQDLEGLYLNYGLHEGKKLAELARNMSFLKITSTDTAEWASRKLGKTDWIQYVRSWGRDSFPNVAEQLHTRDAVSPTDLLGLPDTAERPTEIIVSGFHRLVGIHGVIEHTASYPKHHSDADEDFQPAALQGSLSGWSDDDAARLSIPADPPPEAAPLRPRTHNTERSRGAPFHTTPPVPSADEVHGPPPSSTTPSPPPDQADAKVRERAGGLGQPDKAGDRVQPQDDRAKDEPRRADRPKIDKASKPPPARPPEDLSPLKDWDLDLPGG